MKALFALLIAVSGVSVFAKEVVVSCQTKAYVCRLHQGCNWVATGPILDNTITLIQDKTYPNANAPYEVWRAGYSAFYDQHSLFLRINYSTQDQLHPLSVKATLRTARVSADTSGLDRIDISLHDSNYGRGFFCPSIRYVE